MQRSSILRIPLIALAVCAFSGILFGSHYYLAVRLVLDPALPEPWRTAALIAIGLAGLVLILTPISERTLPPRLSRFIVWPGAVWMGLWFWLLMILGVTDGFLALQGAVASASEPGGSASSAVSGVRAGFAVGLTLLAAGFGLRFGMRPPETRRVEIGIPGWPAAMDGFRIVQISDIHIGSLLDRRFATEVTRRVNALDPDLIAVTGDLVDGGVRQLADEVVPFGSLSAKHGVYFVTGNHDHYSGANSWVAKVEELGMRPLRNERVEIHQDGAVFDLIGVDDHRGTIGNQGGEDLPAALEGRDANRPAVLLAHDPSTFRRASKSGIDLQISGHTHGGQIWPFAYLVRIAVPWVAGHYRSNGSQLYVSRGTGFWGPPMRLFAPSDITELVIRGTSPGDRAFSSR